MIVGSCKDTGGSFVGVILVLPVGFECVAGGGFHQVASRVLILPSRQHFAKPGGSYFAKTIPTICHILANAYSNLANAFQLK